MENLAIYFPFIVLGILLLFVVLFLYFAQPGLWFIGNISGRKYTLVQLALMKWRRSPVSDIVESDIMLAKAGIPVDILLLEATALSGGNLKNIVPGIVLAKNSGLDLSFKKATEADLRGIDLKELVKEAIKKEKPQENFF
jgi:uncharacterized protein YqfA (UPF0365 family)